ncbi:hypothetical protein F66182_3726 [Fusarium sp. NRRL 66182]|nr:hypothetical protein F66182_3726 [Fusarium sp. NRRL 66182]
MADGSDRSQPDTNICNQRKPKFTEEFEPSAELLHHSISEPSYYPPPESSDYLGSTLSLPHSILSNLSSAMQSSSTGYTTQSQDRSINIEERMAEPSGMFISPNSLGLLDLSMFRSPIAGYFKPSHESSGLEFLKGVYQYGTEMEMGEAKAEYEDIWLQLQLLWDLMLRMQPNCIATDSTLIRQAVDFLLDISIARLVLELKPDYHLKLATIQIKCFRRRLLRLELLLRTEMTTCGNSPKILCGCTVAIKRPKHKENLWSRLFLSNTGAQQTRSEGRSLRLRDVAGLIRLEDFLTHVSREYDHQLGRASAEAQSGVIRTAVAFMDDEIKGYLRRSAYLTAEELRSEWVYVLFQPGFRTGLIREVKALVNEAMAFEKSMEDRRIVRSVSFGWRREDLLRGCCQTGTRG